MRISDWSSDVCSSDLLRAIIGNMESRRPVGLELLATGPTYRTISVDATLDVAPTASLTGVQTAIGEALDTALSPLHWQFGLDFRPVMLLGAIRSEEHTSELQSLMRISYAVFCLK